MSAISVWVEPTTRRFPTLRMTLPEIPSQLEPYTGRFPKKAMRAAVERQRRVSLSRNSRVVGRGESRRPAAVKSDSAACNASANVPWEGDDHIPAEDPRAWEPIAPRKRIWNAAPSLRLRVP
jgi:hypothetical protein